MKNPDISTVVVSDVPTLVFSGCGRVRFSVLRNPPDYPQVQFGDQDVVYDDPTLAHNFPGPFDLEFKADARLYAVAPHGYTVPVVVTRWF